MSRDQGAYIADMLEACELICAYVVGKDAMALKADLKTIDAVVRNLEILGEIAKRVGPETRALKPEIPWRAATPSAASGRS